MNRLKKIAQNSRILELLFVAFVVFSFDFIFIIRYGFGVTLGHWIIAFFNVAIVLAVLSFIRNNKARYIAYLIYILIMFTFFLTDSTLYYFKQDVTSIAMLLESGKNTMKIGLKYNPLTPYGIFIWIIIIGFLIFSIRILNKIVKLYPTNKPNRIVKNTLFLIVAFLGVFFSPYIVEANDFLTFNTPADKSLFVQKFGSITYHTRDIVTYANNTIKPIFYSDEYEEIIDETLDLTPGDQSLLYGDLEGDNVIMIMCETCEQYAYSREYTPNYYRLYDEGIHFDNFYSAAKSNYTYDAEFKSLTSMMYFQADNFMYTFGENIYDNALPNVLSDFGYTANSFHDYFGDFFNRDVIHPNMGFDNSYAFEDLDIEETADWPLDSIMFEQMKDLMVPIQEEPFFSFVITVTPHGPHHDYRENLQEYYDILSLDPTYDEAEIELLTLIAAQMDFDKGLGILLDDLEAKDLLSSTTILIYSDHKNYSDYEMTLEYTPDSDIPYEIEKVPFLIYSQKLGSGSSDVLTSHYDVTPTVLDLLGISYIQYYYYGQSVFLEEKLDLPIILTYSSWISHENVILFDEILSGNANEEDYIAKKLSVYDTIDKFEKMFQSDYFNDRQSYLTNP
ncbi:MAG: LTA synthase family protein [Firmicutes bacterium]|nr:LTA synthase family protein [Bacillota bacterium]